MRASTSRDDLRRERQRRRHLRHRRARRPRAASGSSSMVVFSVVEIGGRGRRQLRRVELRERRLPVEIEALEPREPRRRQRHGLARRGRAPAAAPRAAPPPPRRRGRRRRPGPRSCRSASRDPRCSASRRAASRSPAPRAAASDRRERPGSRRLLRYAIGGDRRRQHDRGPATTASANIPRHTCFICTPWFSCATRLDSRAGATAESKRLLRKGGERFTSITRCRSLAVRPNRLLRPSKPHDPHRLLRQPQRAPADR